MALANDALVKQTQYPDITANLLRGEIEFQVCFIFSDAELSQKPSLYVVEFIEEIVRCVEDPACVDLQETPKMRFELAD